MTHNDPDPIPPDSVAEALDPAREAQTLRQDFGRSYQETRKKYNLSIADVAYHLRIQASYIEAIETGQYEKIPGQIYVIGFLKSYAEFLGLDGEYIVAEIKKKTFPLNNKKEKPKLIRSPLLHDQKYPSKWVVIFSTLALFALMILWAALTHVPQSQQVIPPVPQELMQELTALGKPTDTQKPDAIIEASEPIPLVQDETLVLRAKDDVWLQILTAEGQSLFSRVLKQGEEYWVPRDQTDLTVTVGNAGGLDIVIGGQTLQPIGENGQVVRKLSLNPDELLEKYSKPKAEIAQ
jgi:cytoskeleton protein RodZ